MLDTLALMAVLLSEANCAPPCAALLDSEIGLLISAGTLTEALTVANDRILGNEYTHGRGKRGGGIRHRGTASYVAEAYATWGRGHRPAKLNFNDCFAYTGARDRTGCRPDCKEAYSSLYSLNQAFLGVGRISQI